MGADSSKPKFVQKWRAGTKLTFDEKEVKKLQRKIGETAKKEFEEGKTITLQILVFGPTGCGKSSFCNGIKTALSNEESVCHYFAVGAAQEASFTKGFTCWKWQNMIIVDMAGVCEDEAIKEEDVRKILMGQVPLNAKLSDTLKPDHEVPEDGSQVFSCVVLTLKPGMEIPGHTKRLISIAGQLAGEGKLAYHLVLTHLDTVEEQFQDQEKITHILESDAVQKMVFSACAHTGIPPNSVSFVRNYVNETKSDTNSNLLYLDAFDQIVSVAVEQAEKEYMQVLVQRK